MTSIPANSYSVLDSLPGGVVAVTAADGALRGVYANSRMPAIADCPADEYFANIAERPFGRLLPEHITRMAQEFAAGGEVKCDVRALRQDGTLGWLRVNAARAGQEPEEMLYYAWVTDVTHEREEAEENRRVAAELKLRAERDPLTGIYNRATFCEQTAVMLRNNPGEKYVVISCNIERFKLINDLRGRKAGDRVLCVLARTLGESVKNIGTYGRLEADHFGLCLPKPLAFIDVLQHKVATGIERENIESGVTVNFGVYEVDDPEIPVEQMCDRANLALQTIKGNYLQRYAYYDEILRNNLLQEQEIINSMNAALATGQFKVFFQPIYSLTAQRPIAAEALVRWQHSHRGMIPPSEFVPLFERNGFIAKLDFYVWEEVCRFQRARLDAGKSAVPLSVNVSRLNLYNPNLAAEIQKLVSRYRLDSDLLPLEITEGAYSDCPTQLCKTAAALRSCGFSVYMDDFGSGYSSLNALKSIPVDVIKMDMEFLRGLENSENAGNIVTSVVRMAKWLGKPVVAEGVESEEQVRFLQSIGCDRIQGYYFSHPLPAEEFSALLDKGDKEKKAHLPQVAQPLMAGEDDMHALFEGDKVINRLLASIVGGIGVYELTDTGLSVVRVNDGYYDIMGYSPQSFYQDSGNLLDRVEFDDRKPLYAACKRAADGRAGKDIVIRRNRADGRQVLLNVNIRYLGERNGRPLLCLAFNDITGRRSSDLVVQQQRKTLSQYFRFLDTLYHTLPCGIVQYTIGGEIVSANQAACDLFGYPDEEVLKKALSGNFTWVFTADKDYVRKVMAGFERAPQHTAYEHRIVRPDGKVIWISGTLDRVINVNGKELIQCVFQDITEEKNEKHTLQVIMKNLPVGVGIFEIGETPEPRYVSEQVWNIFGITPEEYYQAQMEGRSFSFLPADGRLPFDRISGNGKPQPSLQTAAASLHDRIASSGKPQPFEVVYQALKHDGSLFWLRAVGQVQMDDNGKVLVYAVLNDVTELMAAERQRTKQDELYKMLVEDSEIIVFDYDTETATMEYVSMLPGHNRVHNTVENYFTSAYHLHVLHPDCRGEVSAIIQAASVKPTAGALEYMADYFGEGYARYRCVYKSLADASGRVFRIIGRAYDITEETRAADDLRRKAATDAMTGLCNRAATEESINAKLREAGESGCVFFIIDIDRFKSINDTLGHPVGDQVIKGFASVLKSLFRSDDIIGRLGGDEFGVLVHLTPSKGQIDLRVDAIVKEVRALSQRMDLGIALTASIGVAEAPRDGRTFNELFSNADIALYRAKESGKDRGVLFEPGMGKLNRK